jgi:hypothetical protein
VFSLVTSRGQATPLLWFSVFKTGLAGKRNDIHRATGCRSLTPSAKRQEMPEPLFEENLLKNGAFPARLPRRAASVSGHEGPFMPCGVKKY